MGLVWSGVPGIGDREMRFRMSAISVEEFGRRLEQLSVEHDDMAQVVESGRRLLGELLTETGWFHPILEKLVRDRDYVRGQLNSIWPGEVALWRSPGGSASVLAYIWEPHSVDVIHDHGSWGVIGSLIGSFKERRFRRLDDGKREGYAELEESSCQMVAPGRTSLVLPLDGGIHQTENISDRVCVSINAYGKPIRRGYVQFFDPKNRAVRKAFRPATERSLLAVKALGTVGESWAQDILISALNGPLPDFLKTECERALETSRQERTQA